MRRRFDLSSALFSKVFPRPPSLPINPPDISFGGAHLSPLVFPTANIRANSRPFLLRFQLDENYNHKPVFSNCSNYAPVVKEEEPAGTVVIQVHAEDKDSPEEGGIVYTPSARHQV